MYRLTLYYLIILVVVSFFASFAGLVLYSSLDILISALVLVSFCVISNILFSKIAGAIPNVESVFITALILLLIFPLQFPADIPLLILASIIAMGSKYVFAIKKQHIFNPAALAAFSTGIIFNNGGGIWWVSAPVLLPIVVIGGMLLVRKIRRGQVVSLFLITYFIFSAGIACLNQVSVLDFLNTLNILFAQSALLFFAFVMFTEPLTAPVHPIQQRYYAVFTAMLYALPQVKNISFIVTPEMALIIGNIFSYIISPKEKFILQLKDSKKLASGIYEFIFKKNSSFAFAPGQYMEWTLSHKKSDTRGNRRFFTLASSPTEDTIRLGIRLYEKPSSFKSSLIKMIHGEKIVAGGLAGDFILPKKKDEKLVFVAGGIGITPFRSMLKYLLDTNEKRDIVLLSINKIAEDIVYRDIFEEAEKKIGLKILYILTEQSPTGWKGLVGHLSPEMVREHIADFKDRTFYISGSHIVVTSTKSVLNKIGIKKNRIKTDYFPGF